MAEALFRPLNARDGLQTKWSDGTPAADVVEQFVKPNDRLTAMERLEIYAKSYWFRVLDSLYEDFPGMRAVVGERRFMKMAEAFLARHPSESYTMRDLGSRLPDFIDKEYTGPQPRKALAVEMARFEWAQVVAFDSAQLPPLDAGADKLRIILQPYLTLMECAYPVDDFTLALKKTGLRGDASNAPTAMPGTKRTARNTLPRMPRRARTYVAVHRQDNRLFFKRLEPEAYRILTALRDGLPLEAACAEGLKDAKPGVDWAARVQKWFGTWQAMGWFSKRPKVAPKRSRTAAKRAKRGGRGDA